MEDIAGRILLIVDASVAAAARAACDDAAAALARRAGMPVTLAVVPIETLDAIQPVVRRGPGRVKELDPPARDAMASAPFVWRRDGRPDWGAMWTTFCDLALHGGPPQRGALQALRGPSVDDRAARSAPEIAAELRRGIEETAGLGVEAEQYIAWFVRAAARRHARGSHLGQGEVPRRLPLPDVHVGRRRRHRVARRRGGDHQPEGAAQVLVRAVRADHEEDLLGGVVPHPPRPRRHPRDGHGHAGAVRAWCRRRSTAGGGRSCSSTAIRSRCGPGPDVQVADQVAGQRGGAPAVPRRLRAADPRTRPRGLPTRSSASATTACGSTPSPTGTSSRTSSRAMARRRRSGSIFAAASSSRSSGCATWSRSMRPLAGQPLPAGGAGLRARALAAGCAKLRSLASLPSDEPGASR